MSYQPYKLDQKAQELVLRYRDARNVLNESHKMRATVAYGLERFWGEHLRLWIQAANTSNLIRQQEVRDKGNYWNDTWQALCEIMLHDADIRIPNDDIPRNILSEAQGTLQIKTMATKLWGYDENFPFSELNRKITLAVLTQLCDSLVWWAQRYKKANERDNPPQ